jgi:hypothetical protein
LAPPSHQNFASKRKDFAPSLSNEKNPLLELLVETTDW